ncbi:TIGR03885 family FMN-dependent LLM class oxidoreductase [Chitinispirillales bacterium ANBcel5]|uniref:TIGR03885 family FMN-dependent LLM class oxidoreductase n=1 Tax=Cellulosispirillum alkaliphilum TaxID=3039283 RepID=UPI002A5981CF|nr:TIGR03885 family FMN-dependent LLM class oxidoreductase [Chitinispirillales bacterium ANBcel5]
MVGYHASHEQFKPSDLLRLVQMAESVGFDEVLSSDHFEPWSSNQAQSGFAWSWLGAAMQATAIPFGVVTAPGYRYNPAIIAQATATLLNCFPDRFWVSVGTGQALNESITGQRWPDKESRKERLFQCAEVMRKLWLGETVTHRGDVTVENANLHTLPPSPPLLIAAAISEDTARWAGQWADGLITISQPREKLKRVVDAFKSAGGENKPMYLKVQLSYAPDENEALSGAFEQWKYVIHDSSVTAELRTPEQFEAASMFITPDQMHEHVRISSSISRFVDWLNVDLEMGFNKLILHNVNRKQERFIEAFGTSVLHQLAT